MIRRAYGLTLVACLAGAGLAAYAITRVWSVRVTPRAGMSDLRAEITGADQAPWVVGLALVALAGTGALLATAGWPRRVLGVLLALVGVAVAAGALVARLTVDSGAAGAAATLWSIICVFGGAAIALGGVTAARHGHHWPGMSARYERRPVPPPRQEPGGAGGPSITAGPDVPPQPAPAAPIDLGAAWEALDRGDDPTDP